MVSKNLWRNKMLDIRSQLGPDKASKFNRDLCKNILFVLAEGGGLVSTSNRDVNARPLWASYKSFRWEADPTQSVFDSTQSVRWAYPRIINNSEIQFLVPFEKDAMWLKNSWGLWEPDLRTAEVAEVSSLTGILVPGVAFDRKGHRLGYGKGFYDRSLADYTGLKVGVCFSVQVADEVLPFDEKDVLMNYIVTDNEILKVQQGDKETRSLV